MRLLLDTCVISELRKIDINPRLKELMSEDFTPTGVLFINPWKTR